MVDKAYKNMPFLVSREARTLRILSEYLEPRARFRHYDVTDTIIMFGSARAISGEEAEDRYQEALKTGDAETIATAERVKRLARYYDLTRELARRMTEWSKTLPCSYRRFIVTSGGGPGLMEAANRGASDAKGLSVGMGISLPKEPGVNEWATRELSFEFHYFFMRKFWFIYLAKAAVVVPGGFGTLDELFEMLTLVQTGKIDRPLPIVLFGREFWDDILDLDALVKWGTISAEDMDLFQVCDTVDEAFDFLTSELERLHPDLNGTAKPGDGSIDPDA